MKVREVYDIIEEKHPYHKSLNEKLMTEISQYRFYSPQDNKYHTQIKGSQYNLTKKEESETVRLILQWIENLILNHDPLYFEESQVHENVRFKTGCWFAKYNEGDETWRHDHKHVLLGFVYFVNCPKGSSPLVFSTSGKKVKPEEGKVVIFPGSLFHHVPKNKCKNRITLAGNIMFDISKN